MPDMPEFTRQQELIEIQSQLTRSEREVAELRKMLDAIRKSVAITRTLCEIGTRENYGK